MDKNFISQGKLLLTGEYLVLAGARALAMPVQYSQQLEVIESRETDRVTWKAFEPGGCWFSAIFSSDLTRVFETSDPNKCNNLLKLLKAAQGLNHGFLSQGKGCEIITTANFPVNWGLGTSSTLISNVAYWAEADPFDLHRSVSEGSGYDIACARASSSLIFQLNDGSPLIREITFDPSFKDQIFFVYLGKKQISASSILGFSKDPGRYSSELPAISEITDLFVAAGSLAEGQALMAEHEKIIGKLLGQEPVQVRFFNDFPGVIKSLGAWGGDFLMVLSDRPVQDVRHYFAQKSLNTVIPFREMVYSSKVISFYHH